MRNHLLAILSVFVFLGSCKKENSTPAASSPSATPSAAVAPASFDDYSGFFTAQTYLSTYAGYMVTSDKVLNAYFIGKPGAKIDLPRVKVNSVSLGLDSLSYLEPAVLYYNNNAKTQPGDTWVIKGANGIPNIKYKTPVQPSADDFNVLPDTVDKKTGFTIYLKNVANITSGSVSISDDNEPWGYISKEIKPGDNAVYFSPEDLKVIRPRNNCSLSFNLQNSTSVRLSGRWFYFTESIANHTFVQVKN